MSKTINLFEGIDEKMVQRVLHNIRQNLDDLVEMYNCHIDKHANRDDEYLQNRILSGEVKMATSFYAMSEKEIKALCTKILEENWEDIQNFLTKPFNKYLAYFETEEAIGFGYIIHKQGVYENLHKVCVSICKDERSPYGFAIESIYPFITRDIVPDKSIKWNCHPRRRNYAV